jgi:hypothetical protein
MILPSVTKRTLNYITLAVFAPVLILAGVAGFLLPPEMSVTSGAPAYNIFHILFGSIGLMAVLSRRESLVRSFNFGFGLIDLYQALASYLHLPPEQYFRWTRVDDFFTHPDWRGARSYWWDKTMKATAPGIQKKQTLDFAALLVGGKPRPVLFFAVRLEK